VAKKMLTDFGGTVTFMKRMFSGVEEAAASLCPAPPP